jgi:histidinol-phosphatase (PHP family)
VRKFFFLHNSTGRFLKNTLASFVIATTLFMPADYHTHTPLCHHATGTPEEYVETAIEKGLIEYGISDHTPVNETFFDDWRMLYSDLTKYIDWIESAKKSAANRIPVRAGLECDWLPNCEDWIEKICSEYDWDYLIGAVHYLEDWNFDNPKWLGRWAETDVEKVWQLYWKEYAAMAESQLFDILAHPDLIKKFCHKPAGDLTRFYEPAIESIAVSGCAIEINTAGWHKPCAEAYPTMEFLELARAAGIPLVISSDAHSPHEVGRDFSQASEIIRKVGYQELSLFEKRQRKSEKL